MTEQPAPVPELDERFGIPGIDPTPWSDAVRELERQRIAWFTSVRRDGRPHTTPLVFVWTDGRLFLHSGEGEQKMLNLEANPACTLTAGQESDQEGLDVVVEGDVVRRDDLATHTIFRDALAAKYPDWSYELDGQGIVEGDRRPVVLEIIPSKIFAFGKGERASQTRYRFS